MEKPVVKVSKTSVSHFPGGGSWSVFALVMIPEEAGLAQPLGKGQQLPQVPDFFLGGGILYGTEKRIGSN